MALTHLFKEYIKKATEFISVAFNVGIGHFYTYLRSVTYASTAIKASATSSAVTVYGML